jgi:hypothetical protein
MNKRVLLLSLVCSFHLGLAAQPCNWSPKSPVKEVAYPISDWAITNYINGEWVILYNPAIWNTLPISIKLFTRAHEYAHIELRHLVGVGQTLYRMIEIKRENELAADTQAAEWLLESGCQGAVSDMAAFFDSMQYRNMALPPWYPSYTERRDNLLRILEDSGEPIDFSIEIPFIKPGELGGTIEIFIDGKDVGTISNFDDDYDTSIDVTNLKSGIHSYRLRVKIYTFRGWEPLYQRTIYGEGSINIQDLDRLIVSNGAINPVLLKYK